MTREVWRDAWGIPHLRADSLNDLAWLQGCVTAEDRAWQLAYGNWRAQGRTAEVLGRGGVAGDVFIRRAQVLDTARRCWSALDADTADWLAAYVAGVNDGLGRGAARSAELRSVQALGLTPDAWDPWTPIAHMIAQHALFGGLAYKIARTHLRDRLGAEIAALLRLEGEQTSGSNAWLVAGSRTASGAAVIAGDSHRTIEQPGPYQQIRLSCPGVDVAGMALPGVPGVPHFGHAGAVAWAITNAMGDYHDLYEEQVRRDGDRLVVREADGWQPCPTRVEEVLVRGAAAVRVEIAETARGPLVIDDGPDRSYSMRTPTRVEADEGFAAMRRLLLARTTAEVTAALEGWVEPVNSYLVADTTGDLRHVVTGRVPVRDPGAGAAAVPGSDDRYAWRGYAQPLVEPVDEVMACANDRASGGGFGFDYAPDDRAVRIAALLADRSGLDAEAMTAIHLDTLQAAVPRLRSLLGTLDPAGLTADQQAVREALLGWDGRADADSREASVFADWRSAVVGELVALPVFAPLRETHDADGSALRPTPGDHSMPAADRFGSLFAVLLSPEVRIGTAWQRLVAADNPLDLDLPALAARALATVASGATASGEATAGGDTARTDDDAAAGASGGWSLQRVLPWSQRHLLAPLHPFLAAPDLDVELFSVGLPGDIGCVCATHSVPAVSDRCSFGPVARYVWDLADRSRSGWAVPQGSSACIDSPHRADQQPLWATGRLVPLVTDWAQLRPDGSR